jgi:hypothetical protein
LQPKHHSASAKTPEGNAEHPTRIRPDTLNSNASRDSLSAYLQQAFDLNSSQEQLAYGRPYRYPLWQFVRLAKCHPRLGALQAFKSLIQPHVSQQDKHVRIDRLLVPTSKLNGWTYGCMGMEFKRSGTKIGGLISLMPDYSGRLWQLPNGGISVALGWNFLWAAQTEHGEMASIFAQQRISTACPSYGVSFFAEEVRVLNLAPHGTFQIGKCDIEESLGSR